MKFSHTSPPFVVETSPVFAPQNLLILASRTRFHFPLYLPLNNLTPLKIIFPYEMNAPLLPFLFQLRTLSSLTFYQQFVSTINLPFRHFLYFLLRVLFVFPPSFLVLISWLVAVTATKSVQTVFPLQSCQTVRFRTEQPDFMLERPQRIILDTTNPDPWD